MMIIVTDGDGCDDDVTDGDGCDDDVTDGGGCDPISIILKTCGTFPCY